MRYHNFLYRRKYASQSQINFIAAVPASLRILMRLTIFLRSTPTSLLFAMQFVPMGIYPEEPFDRSLVIQTAPLQLSEGRDSASRISHDIVAATGRQMFCHYQVLLPHFEDPKFISTAAERYLVKFLGLRNAEANPTFGSQPTILTLFGILTCSTHRYTLGKHQRLWTLATS